MELIVYILLGLTSVVALAFVIERAIALQWRKVVPPEIETAVQSCRSHQDVALLRRVCEQKPSPLSRLLIDAADHLDWPQEENVAALETRARHEVVKLERGLVVLEITVGIAPLLGLVGTIIGMMTLFGHLGQNGLSDAGTLAKGIALILRATLWGLLIAIPALITWSYFSKKIETLAIEMESLCDQFIRRQYREEVQSPKSKVQGLKKPASAKDEVKIAEEVKTVK
ncbi:MAG TPA: MotA/TolQ/ExbB proton channel family protein [Candidatus Angelobacter sp.]|nr:MotA/TolQ/ExbB proton channel family protein [Candidatus Angelobacter sp.]